MMKTKLKETTHALCGLMSGLLVLVAQPVSAQNPLFGVSNSTDKLYTIDTATGVPTEVGALGSPNLQGLAFDPGGTLYGADSGTDQLVTIDTTTGAATVVGAFGFGNVRSIAFDSGGTLFGVDTSTDRLLVINTTTGGVTAVGALGFGNVIGLAFDSSGTLYGVDSTGNSSGSGQLLTINTTTGTATAVGGPLGFSTPNALAFDLSTNTLFSFDWATRQLLTVNTTTGEATAVGANIGFQIRGLSMEMGTIGVTSPDSVTLACNSSDGATRTVTFGFGHADNLPLTVEWSVDNVLVATRILAGGTTSDSLVDYPFSWGPHTVSVSVTDGVIMNAVTAGTTVTVAVPNAPVPTVESLPDLTGECSVTISTAPTASDCFNGGNIFPGTTDTPLPLTFDAQGEYTVTWTYTDPDVAPELVCPRSQYASSVIDFSSEHRVRPAVRLLGEPDTFNYGTRTTAWLPSGRNIGQVDVTVGFATPVFANGATIRETAGNGFVYQVDVVDTSGALHTVWTGVDPSVPGTPRVPVDFFVAFPETSFLVSGLKIYVDTSLDSFWEGIDAIALHGIGCPTTSQTQKVIVKDITPPVIDCPADITIAWSPAYEPGTTVVVSPTGEEATLGSATATDNCDASPEVNYSDSVAGLCPTVITRTWTATDAAGNPSGCEQIITVNNLFAVDGIIWHQPLARSGMSEDTDPSDDGALKYGFKLGKTIPIQIHAMGCDGNVSENANVTGTVVVYGDTDMDGVADSGAIPIDYNGVGGDGGMMDKVGPHLKYNLDTKTLKAIPDTKCYLLEVTVTDTNTWETVSEMIPLQAK